MLFTRPHGLIGEQLAQRYLRRQGYFIWKTNWRKKIGELDIIAYRDHTLVFFEVKTRFGDSSDFFPALDAVDHHKQGKLIATARRFMREEWRELKRRRLWRYRFDVLGMYIPIHLWEDVTTIHWKEAFSDEGQARRRVRAHR